MSEHELKLKCLEFITNNPNIEGTKGGMENLLSQVDKLYKFIVKDDNANK
jgi:hypothetical protein